MDALIEVIALAEILLAKGASWLLKRLPLE
jgi:hypothetical protein